VLTLARPANSAASSAPASETSPNRGQEKIVANTIKRGTAARPLAQERMSSALYSPSANASIGQMAAAPRASDATPTAPRSVAAKIAVVATSAERQSAARSRHASTEARDLPSAAVALLVPSDTSSSFSVVTAL
jgi:hypothetical protein